jgi:hypothetical protein
VRAALDLVALLVAAPADVVAEAEPPVVGEAVALAWPEDVEAGAV